MNNLNKALSFFLVIALVVIAYQFGINSSDDHSTSTPEVMTEEVNLDPSGETTPPSITNTPSTAEVVPEVMTEEVDPVATDEDEAEPAAEEDPVVEEEEKILACPRNYNPVCGKVDGEMKTFGNECEANLADASDIVEGVCAEEEVPNVGCLSPLKDMCGTVDGERVDFESKCKAESAGATDVVDGKCPGLEEGFNGVDPNLVLCKDEVKPVCGELEVVCVIAPCDPIKKQYNNACLAYKAGAKNITEGFCEPLIFIPGIIAE